MEKIDADIDLDNLNMKLEGTYSEQMAEKLKREVNMMLYSQDFYCFGYSLETGLTELASASKGVIPNE